jgi:hypothetical protein
MFTFFSKVSLILLLCRLTISSNNIKQFYTNITPKVALSCHLGSHVDSLIGQESVPIGIALDAHIGICPHVGSLKYGLMSQS